MKFISTKNAYNYLIQKLILCKEEEYEEMVQELIISNIDICDFIKSYLNNKILNKTIRKKIIDIACKNLTSIMILIDDCLLIDNEKEYILNIIFDNPEYSLIYRRYLNENNKKEKYKALKSIIKNEEYFTTLLTRSYISHFIKLDEIDIKIMVSNILKNKNAKLAKAAYYSRYLNLNSKLSDLLWPLVTLEILVNN